MQYVENATCKKSSYCRCKPDNVVSDRKFEKKTKKDKGKEKIENPSF